MSLFHRFRPSRKLLILALGLVLVLGVAGLAEDPVPTTLTIDEHLPDPSVVGEPIWVHWCVVPTPKGGDSVDGTITVVDGEGNTCSKTMDSGNDKWPWPNGWCWGCNLAPTSIGVKTFTATFVPLDSTAFDGSSDTVQHTVNKADTATSVSTSGSPSVSGEPVTFTATVSAVAPGGGIPTGSVAFYAGGTSIGSGSSSTGTVTFTTSELSIDSHSITAQYLGSADYNASPVSAPITQEVTKRSTTVTVSCSDTALIVNDTATGTVTVTDTSPGAPSIPTGNVTVSVSPSGAGALTVPGGPPYTLDTGDAGQFKFTYTPSSAADTSHEFTATYSGDSAHYTSGGTFNQAIDKREVDIQLSLTPMTAYIGQGVPVTVHVEDDTTAGTPPDTLTGKTVTLSATGFGVTGAFSPNNTPTLDGNGNCTVTYTPVANEAGTTTLTVTFAEDNVYLANSATQTLIVNLRPTTTTISGPAGALIVYQTGNFTVDVEDTAGVGTATAPLGTIDITPSLDSTSDSMISTPSGPTGSTPKSSWTFSYYRKGLNNDGDYDTLAVAYTANDGIHEDSGIGFAQAIIRRPTETTLSGCACDSDGVTCTVTVADHPDNPAPPTGITLSGPAGDFFTMADDDGDNVVEYTDVGNAPGAVNVHINSDLIMTNVTIQYKPTDKIYQKSTASENVDRSSSSCMTDPDPHSGDATSCSAGCGSGGVNVNAIVYGLNAGCLAASSVALALDAAMLAVDPTPDPIVGAGFLVITGVTIPTSDILATIIGIAKIALETYSLIACTDLDGDGIPDVVELGTTGTSTTKTDTDGDAMGDSDEIGYCAGYYGGTLRPNPNNPDSDSDGLMDGYELAPFATDVCVADTDCDTIPDGIEVACRTEPTAANGFYRGGTGSYADTFSALGYSFAFPTDFNDERDQPNPREADTDGDGLRDDVEFGPGVIVYSSSTTPYSPYVNDPDSDGDGILDGNESTNGDATWDGNVVGTGANVTTGETHLCLADTDGDGLTDGEEEGLFGRGAITVHTPSGTDTIPALDSDMDDDYLTDYEEVNVYNTSPVNCDSDSDGVADSVEVATWDATIHARLQAAYDPKEFNSATDYLGYFALIAGLGASADSRNHADPNADDTDGDGLTDDLEIAYDCNCGTGMDGYVNDDDSDDDGLQDGREFELYGVGADVAKSDGNDGELNDDTKCSLCDYDSDGDGLSDGEEVFTGLATDPLDWDVDDDGLSDLEEIRTYYTDPHLADTDGDTADGVIVARNKDFTDAAHPALSGHSGNGTIACLSDCEEVFSGTLLFNPLYPTTVPSPGISGYGNPLDETDPLQMDTDGDGINDNIEFNPGCNDGPSGPGTGTALFDGFANSFDSDADGLRDYEDAIGDVFSASTITIDSTPVTRDWLSYFETPLPVPGGFKAASPDGLNDGELGDDIVSCMCDSDSDNDGVLDGGEHEIGTDPYDWDTDDDGRKDSEYLGQGPIPTDPLDFDTDDDGLSDGVEVFGANPTNPVNADTDFDGLPMVAAQRRRPAVRER